MLNRIIILGTESPTLNEFIAKSFELIVPAMEYTGGGIYLYDPTTNTNILAYYKNLTPDFLERYKEVKMDASESYRTMKVYVSKDASRLIGEEQAKIWKIISAVGIPLVQRERYMGSLNLYTSKPHDFSEREIDFLRSIGNHLGVIIEKYRNEEEVKKKNVELTALNKIITLGNESKSLMEFIEKAYAQVLEIVEFDRGGVYLYDPDSSHDILVYHINVHPEFVAAVEDVDISKGIFQQVFDKKKLYYIEDFSKFMPNSKEIGVYSAAIVPLRSEDEYVGSLNIGSPTHQVLNPTEIKLLLAIGKEMGTIIQKFKAERLLMESEEKFRIAYKKADFYRDLMAHDLNNILQGILISAELGSTNLENKEDLRYLLESIRNNVIRSGKLIATVQKLSDFEEKEITLKSMDILEILNGSIKVITESFPEKTLRITINFPEHDIIIHSNEFLTDVFENILHNAVKFSNSENVLITINVFELYKNKNKWIRMEFIDQGQGISDDHKEKIFLRGQQSVHGTGLGLSLVKTIIESIKGEIWVEDRLPGDYTKGSKFILLIPEREVI